jgi:phage baseplate assembly protein W
LLILGGGQCGLELARDIVDAGYASRIVTRGEARRAEIEGVDAECWVGDPDRLGTLRGALEGVTIACWLLASATGSEEQLRALHGSRLRSFLGQAIDTTMRGFVYEATGSVPAEVLRHGERIAVEECTRNEIPMQVLRTTPMRPDWQEAARYAVDNLLKTDRDS